MIWPPILANGGLCTREVQICWSGPSRAADTDQSNQSIGE